MYLELTKKLLLKKLNVKGKKESDDTFFLQE